MKELPWFRLYPEIIYDEKIVVASDRTESSYLEVLGVWIILLALASKSHMRGSLFVSDDIPYEDRDIANICHITTKQARTIIDQFVDLDMLEDNHGGAIHVKNWKDRQYEKTSEEKKAHAEYVREWRNDKELSQNVSQNNHNEITNLSPSVSVSVSESLIKELNAKTNFSNNDVEKALLQVLNIYPLPSTYNQHLDHVLDLLQHYGWDETIRRLTTAKDNWVSQKNKTNGANYKITNPAWIDYAITGESIGSSPGDELKRLQELEDKKYREAAEANKYRA